MLGNKLRLGQKIGGAPFGEIYLGTNIQTNEEVAIKLENVKTKHPQLLYESKLYRILQGRNWNPKCQMVWSRGIIMFSDGSCLDPVIEDLFNFVVESFTKDSSHAC